MIGLVAAIAVANPWLVFDGHKGPGKGKSVVLLAGDEEYRSEEGLVQLAKILSERHGFKCTVCFSIDKQGFIDPTTKDNEPGIEALDHADVCIMLLRFREWPDEQMKHFVDYVQRGKPIIALRTSTHAFDYAPSSTSPYKRFSWNSKDWPGGFGKQVLGETWLSHWGVHGKEATRGILRESAKVSPIFRSFDGLFGTTDVYEAHPPKDATILVDGQVLTGLNPTDLPATYQKQAASEVWKAADLAVRATKQSVNNPMMPIVWTRTAPETNNWVFTCTMGAATDLLDEGLRRMLVNATYFATGLEKKIPKKANVDFIGHYEPSPFGFGKFKKGVRPSDLAD